MSHKVLFFGLLGLFLMAPATWAGKTKTKKVKAPVSQPNESSKSPAEQPANQEAVPSAADQGAAESPPKKEAPALEPTADAEKKVQGEAVPRLLMLDLKATLVQPEVAKIVTGMLSAELGQYEEYDMITGQDLRQMVALEAEKQSIGCADDSSCLAELAGAMGARFVIFGDVGKLDDIIVVNLNLFDSTEAKAAGRGMIQANSLGQLPAQVPPAVQQLLFGEKRSGADNAVAAPVIKAPAKPFPWMQVGSASGVAVAGFGVALGWGLPSLLTVIEAEDAHFAAGAEDHAKYQAAEDAQEAYLAGPVWGLAVGGTVGLAAAGYAIYVAATFEE